MKRFQVLSIILLTGLLLVVAAFYWPENGVQVGEKAIAFMPKEVMLDFKVVDNSEKIDSTIALLEARSYGIDEDAVKRMSILDESTFSQSSFFINPETGVGQTALDDFFSALQHCDSSVIRVGHYGDSQIEGDRMTSLLRIMFQEKFSGNGVGYVPIEDVTSPVSYARSASSNWVRYTVFHNRSAKGLYGPGGTCYRYRFSTPESTQDSITSAGDTIKIRVSGQTYANATVHLKLHRGYSIARLWYGKAMEPAELKVYNSSNNELLAEVTMNSEESFNVLKLPLKTNATSLKCVFTGPSPEIYGFSFDPSTGVQFDNYGLRGHSGDGIMNISQGLLSAEYIKLNNKLVILQYGGNVTPYVKNEASLNNIKKIYDKLYHYVKAANPDASVLVIGVNDVARNVGGSYASYPMVGKIRDAQKEVALKNGCAFFDLLELMGGENSVMAWYNKGWASRDGHYSNKGREIVVNELFMALMGEYNKFLMRGSTADK